MKLEIYRDLRNQNTFTMASAVNNSSVANESQEESKFAGVVFHNIQDVYIPGKDIRCCFSIKPSVSTTPNDWIGLYKVGWKSQKEYLCYEYSPVVETSTELYSSGSLNVSLSVQNSVVFCGSKLPTEECEFYQFCYVTSSGEIRGASYPFQISFTKPGDLEICSEEEDESLLVVNNRTTILEDSLSKAREENATLKASKETVEANCLRFQDMILILEGEKNELVSLNEKQKAMLEKAISEKTEVQESLKDSVEKLTTAQIALKVANDKTTEVQQQLDNERFQHDQTTSEQQKFEEERSHFLQVISQKDGAIQNFLETVAENGGKISALESEVLKLKSENEAVQEKYDNVVVEKTKGDDSLEKSEQAYSALEKSHAEQLEEVYKLQAENTSMRDELGVVHGQLEEMSNWLSNQQSSMKEKHLKECSDLESQIETITSQLESCKQELAAADQKLDEAVKTLGKEQKANQELVQGYEDSIVKLLNQLDQERAFNNSLSSASDRQVAELQEQLNAQLQKNSSVLKKTEEQTQEIKQLEEKIKLDQGKIEELQQEIEDKTQQLEASKERENESLQSKAPDTTSAENNTALEGSYFALKTAHDQLRKQYLQLKKDMESVWRQKADLKRQLATVQSETPDSDLKFQMANLKKQIEDLRIRLNMGAEAYKAKFKECQKYEKQLKKIRKDSSGPTNLPSGSKLEKQNLKLSMDEAKTSAALNKSLEEYKQELEKVNLPYYNF